MFAHIHFLHKIWNSDDKLLMLLLKLLQVLPFLEEQKFCEQYFSISWRLDFGVGVIDVWKDLKVKSLSYYFHHLKMSHRETFTSAAALLRLGPGSRVNNQSTLLRSNSFSLMVYLLIQHILVGSALGKDCKNRQGRESLAMVEKVDSIVIV